MERRAEHLSEIVAPIGWFTRRPPRTFARGRVCAERGCGTVLSIYNPGSRCAIHAPATHLVGGPGVGRKRKEMVA